MEREKECEICFKIKCKNCGWEPSDAEYAMVASGKLTSCPACGSLKG